MVHGHLVHKNKIVKAFVASVKRRLQLLYLLGYLPELNSDEQVWNNF